ncbi:MAG: RNA polymerase sigma factor, partial [Chloroflexota bacterium]
TFARAHRALARLEPEGTLRPWLYRVAINLSYNRRPRTNIIVSTLEDAYEEVFESGERSPASLAELAELRRVVLAAVDTLGPKHRVVVVLHYLNGLNLAEIAMVVDCPVGTVKSRLHYALRRLRTHLAAHPELGFEPASSLPATPSQTLRPAVKPVIGGQRE